jgi:hypothetical protein
MFNFIFAQHDAREIILRHVAQPTEAGASRWGLREVSLLGQTCWTVYNLIYRDDRFWLSCLECLGESPDLRLSLT